MQPLTSLVSLDCSLSAINIPISVQRTIITIMVPGAQCYMMHGPAKLHNHVQAQVDGKPLHVMALRSVDDCWRLLILGSGCLPLRSYRRVLHLASCSSCTDARHHHLFYVPSGAMASREAIVMCVYHNSVHHRAGQAQLSSQLPGCCAALGRLVSMLGMHGDRRHGKRTNESHPGVWYTVMRHCNAWFALLQPS
jgi:hypothetical protein